MAPLRVSAIDFLNPAPLMWDFDHPPASAELLRRYLVTRTQPAQCARDLHEGRADLGLIPVAALTPELRIVPGCAIASLGAVRSILLVTRAGQPLERVRTVAADTASRSSVAYAEVLFRHFLSAAPTFVPAPADLPAMLATANAALVIGDPALLALERRAETERAHGPLVWHDVASLWHRYTGLPWLAAVWAVRPEAVPSPAARRQLTADLNRSRDRGLAHIPALVREWSSRIALPPATIHDYLARNIHYHLDPAVLDALRRFRSLAAEHGILPPLGEPRLLAQT